MMEVPEIGGEEYRDKREAEDEIEEIELAL